MCYKNSRDKFYCDVTLKPSQPISPSLLYWQFILGEWTDEHVRKAILAKKTLRI